MFADCIRGYFVNNEEVGLLRVIRNRATEENEHVLENFPNLQYFRVVDRYIGSINITIRDKMGDVLPMTNVISCLLHFRQTQP